MDSAVGGPGVDVLVLDTTDQVLSFAVTNNLRYIIYSVSTTSKNGGKYVGLRLLNQVNGNTFSIDEHFAKPREDLQYFATIAIVDVPIVHRERGLDRIEKSKWLIINTDDKLEAIEFSSFFDKNIMPIKWQLDNSRDCITSFVVKPDFNGSINVLCCAN